MRKLDLNHRFSGCLIGQGLGDALGFPVEGRAGRECREYVANNLSGRAVGPGRWDEIRRRPFACGQYTDDTQLARELMQSYVACGALDPADYGRRVGSIFSENRIVGRGRATETAALKLAAGEDWRVSGTPAPNAGNGSAMRAGPVGLMFHDDPAALCRAADDQGKMTHADPRCTAGAIAIAGSVAYSIAEKNFSIPEFVEQIAELVRPFDAILAQGIVDLKSWLALPPEKAVGFIRVVGGDPSYSDGWDGISPFVTTSVLWSLYAFLRSRDDYWETVCTSIAVGGDVDTTAAMAGAVSGAFNGLDGIPEVYAEHLNDQGSWRYQELVDLARDCCRIKSGQ